MPYEQKKTGSDLIERLMNREGTVRILVARSTETVREAVQLAKSDARVSDSYGRLLTGAALLQLAQAPSVRLQTSLRDRQSSELMLADVWPGPQVRGRIGAIGHRQDHPATNIFVSRQSAGKGKELYQSAVPIRDGCIADALQTYVLNSEQVLTFFSLATVIHDNEVVRAGGLLVQALPGMQREHLAEATTCLERAHFSDLVTAGDDPIDAADALFAPLQPVDVGSLPLCYHCRCNKERALGAISILGENVVEEIRNGSSEEVICEFCGTQYLIGAQDLETNESYSS